MLVDVVVPDGLDSEVEVLDLLKLLLGTVAVGLPLGVRADGAGPDRNVDPWIVIRPPRVRDAAVRDAAAHRAGVRLRASVRGAGRSLAGRRQHGWQRPRGLVVAELGLAGMRLERPAERLGIRPGVGIAGGDVWRWLGPIVVGG